MSNSQDKVPLVFVELKLLNYEVGTPSRRFCNMLWNTINCGNFKAQLRDNNNLFDVACGNGKYGFKY